MEVYLLYVERMQAIADALFNLDSESTVAEIQKLATAYGRMHGEPIAAVSGERVIDAARDLDYRLKEVINSQLEGIAHIGAHAIWSGPAFRSNPVPEPYERTMPHLLVVRELNASLARLRGAVQHENNLLVSDQSLSERIRSAVAVLRQSRKG